MTAYLMGLNAMSFEETFRTIIREELKNMKFISKQNDDDPVWDIDEAANYLKVTKWSLYRDKSVPHKKVGKELRFKKSAIDKWLTRRDIEF